MNYEYKQIFDLTHRTAIVTGGLGILGRQFCRGLAEFNASVVVVDLDETAATEFAAELSSETGVDVLGLRCDVSDEVEVEAMVKGVVARSGSIDILLNNAASKSSDLTAFFAPVESYSLEEWRTIMRVNLDGAFLVAKHVGTQMATQSRGGSIVQTTSIYGMVGSDRRIYEGSSYMGREINNPASYSTSKAGLLGLTKYLATYWADKGVRVNALVPGGVESGQNDIFKQKYSSRVPMGRMARAGELVGAVIFLASDASSYITGQSIVVDGGLTAW
jgi:NAD(P)-dependent dehydrogenase (short-subunit alcohol dehydrogenase family)